MAEQSLEIPKVVTCKCCGSAAHLFGAVDFNKTCEEYHGRIVFPEAGIPVHYHRCSGCGFVFTIAFDYFGENDFAEFIYNDQYALADPEYAEIRPKQNAGLISRTFGAHPEIRILDFGGGNGRLAAELRDTGFRDVEAYDPFVPEHASPPEGTFDLVLAFEIIEHSPAPAITLAAIDSLLRPDGMVFFSTVFVPDEIEEMGLSWWYAAPRNGHVSLHTPESVAHLTEPCGFNFASLGPVSHVLYRQVPHFARTLIRSAA